MEKRAPNLDLTNQQAKLTTSAAILVRFQLAVYDVGHQTIGSLGFWLSVLSCVCRESSKIMHNPT